jgi:outer membrane protein OmpA-like peptidoglycan-associated protein
MVVRGYLSGANCTTGPPFPLRRGNSADSGHSGTLIAVSSLEARRDAGSKEQVIITIRGFCMKSFKQYCLPAVFSLAALASPLAFSAECTAPGPGTSLQLGGCMAGDTLVLRGVNFETASAALTADSVSLLQSIAAELKANPTVKVAIQGHTDAVGSEEYNLMLSQNRAGSVEGFLVEAGVNPRQLEPVGYGFSMPMADNATTAGRAMNRRVELKMVGTLTLAPTKPQKVFIVTHHAKPATLTVPVGTKVEWENYDEISHDIAFEDGMLARIWTKPWQGMAVSKTFNTPGEYHYHCTVHKDVNGKIVVKPVGADVAMTEGPVFGGQTMSSFKAE